MSATGIITEFNPFHNGHKIHIEETRKMTKKPIIAVMSGNFVQRGEPALCNKWARTKMALLNGVDIILEIPVFYVLSGADYFARGSVEILAATGVVDEISFGSECGDLMAIKEAGKILAKEPLEYKKNLQKCLKKGMSFAAAKGYALEKALNGIISQPQGLLIKPNNALAMEYCKALYKMGSQIDVITTHRKSGGTSATKIRKEIANNNFPKNCMPENCKELLQEIINNNETAYLNDFSEMFRYLMYSHKTKNLTLPEGLENRLREHVGSNKNLSDIISAVKTKRYTHTRLQRTVFQILLDINNAETEIFLNEKHPPYIRVLGFRKESAKLLGELTKKSKSPVITHGKIMDEILNSDTLAAKMLAKEFEAGDIYRLATGVCGKYRCERGVGVVVI